MCVCVFACVRVRVCVPSVCARVCVCVPRITSRRISPFGEGIVVVCIPLTLIVCMEIRAYRHLRELHPFEFAFKSWLLNRSWGFSGGPSSSPGKPPLSSPSSDTGGEAMLRDFPAKTGARPRGPLPPGGRRAAAAPVRATRLDSDGDDDGAYTFFVRLDVLKLTHSL